MLSNTEKIYSAITQTLLSLTSFLVILVVWSFVTYGEMVETYFLPSPTEVVSEFWNLIQKKTLLTHTATSIKRILIGFIASILIGLPLGLGIGLIRPIKLIFNPLVQALRYTPVIAFIPLLVLWFGIGDLQKVVVIVLGTSPYLAVLVAVIIKNMQAEYIDTSYTLGATRWQVFNRVVIPYALPSIWDALRVTLGIAWTYLLTAELVGANFGLGHFIIRSQRFLQTANILISIAIIGAIGLISDYAFKFGYNRFFRWSVLANSNSNESTP